MGISIAQPGIGFCIQSCSLATNLRPKVMLPAAHLNFAAASELDSRPKQRLHQLSTDCLSHLPLQSQPTTSIRPVTRMLGAGPSVGRLAISHSFLVNPGCPHGGHSTACVGAKVQHSQPGSLHTANGFLAAVHYGVSPHAPSHPVECCVWVSARSVAPPVLHWRASVASWCIFASLLSLSVIFG